MLRWPTPPSSASAPRSPPEPSTVAIERSVSRVSTMTQPQKEWPLYEVFIRARAGMEHKHVGSIHATDARMAMHHARDVYTRRQEGISIWVVRSADIVASDPAEAAAL